MEKSKVFFTNLRTTYGVSLLDKFERLIKTAGIEQIDFKKKFTAIKIHFGEPGNLAYIRHHYVKRLSNIIQYLGGIPFMTDSNTLYSGKRANALDHINSALENGFTPISTGCNIIIADGIKGTDYKKIPVNATHIKNAKIATAIADSDILISMNHFKGHELSGFGGALKNLGMGSGSRAGKKEMHSCSKPKISAKKCTGCGMCIKNCSQNAISLADNSKAVIDYDHCIGCGQCIVVCQYKAAQLNWDESFEVLNEKIAEYAFAAIKDKPSFHINFAVDISPDCDCYGHNDLPIIPDIGIFASFDPVALDKACADMAINAPVMNNSLADEKSNSKSGKGIDKFEVVHPGTCWLSGLKHCQNLGVGNLEYEIVKI